MGQLLTDNVEIEVLIGDVTLLAVGEYDEPDDVVGWRGAFYMSELFLESDTYRTNLVTMLSYDDLQDVEDDLCHIIEKNFT